MQVEILVPNMTLLESKAFGGQEGGDPRKRSAFTLEGPLRAFLAISGQYSEEVSVCGHGTWLSDFQPSQPRTICPKCQVYRTEAEKPVRASSHILQLLSLLPAGVW